MLNRKLNKLQEVFDRIESYDPSQNVGLRSLKNIGVWLCVYALTNEHDQNLLIHELTQKAHLKHKAEIVKIKKIIDELVQPETLAAVITDYEAANGSFTLSVNSEAHLHNLRSKIEECHYQNILSSHVKLDPSQNSSLVFLMKNEIKFNWSACNADYNLTPGELDKFQAQFCGSTIDYLSANSEKHDVKYNLVEHNKRLFHVVCLGTLQKNGNEDAKRSNAYLIESVDANDAALLQKDYFAIISIAKEMISSPEAMYKTLNTGAYDKVQNLQIIGQKTGDDIYRYRINFPQIAAPMKTTEERLGIYAHYQGKVIANILADQVGYKGVRELTYDEKGGEIKNHEEFSLRECAVCEPNCIYIQYTAANPFMMVYEAINGADYYPYFIADPSKNLELSFDSSKPYPSQHKTKGFASQGQSTFTPPPVNTTPVVNTNSDAPKSRRCNLL